MDVKLNNLFVIYYGPFKNFKRFKLKEQVIKYLKNIKLKILLEEERDFFYVTISFFTKIKGDSIGRKQF